MCLDGLIHFFTDQSPAAADRLKAAHALASTYRFRAEQAFSAAWLAHIEFNRNRWEAMAEALSSCHAALDRSDRAIAGRWSLVIADALLYAGSVACARDWYSQARGLFTSIGDHAAIEAFLYNRAALRLHAARLQAISNPVSRDELTILGGEISSATNYQRLTQQRSLDYLLDQSTASHKLLCNDLSGAREILRALLVPGVIAKGSTAQPLVLADLALCEAEIRNQEAAVNTLGRAKQALLEANSPDDIAIAAHSMHRACLALQDQSSAVEWASRRDEALNAFEANRERLKAVLARWAVDPVDALSESGR
jgi:hypothetical protein